MIINRSEKINCVGGLSIIKFMVTKTYYCRTTIGMQAWLLGARLNKKITQKLTESRFALNRENLTVHWQAISYLYSVSYNSYA